jgi:general secretion pathway protein D
MLWMLLLSGVHAQGPAPNVREEVREDGSVMLVPARQTPADLTRADKVLLEFEDVSLYELARYFADVLRKNFLLSDDRALRDKRVQFVGHSAVSVEEAWMAFHQALSAHGFTVVEGSEMFTIVPSSNAKQSALEVGEGAPPAGELYGTRLLEVKNARVADLMPIVTPLLSKDAEVVAYAPGNKLIVTDNANNVRKVAELVALLDEAAPSTTMKTIQLKHASAAEVKAAIEAVFVTQAAPVEGARKPAPAKGPKARTEPVLTKAGEEEKLVTKVLDYERTNMLVVMANAEGHAAVMALVAELDADVAIRKHLHVVHPRYALAEEIAMVLEQLREEDKARPMAKPATGKPEEEEDGWTNGSARFAADPATNTLAVVAEPEEYEAIAELIAELDVARGQVFVDAVFVELTSTEGEELALGAHVMPSEDSPGLLSAQLDSNQSFNSFTVSPDLLTGLASGVFGPLVEVVGADGSLLQVPVFGIALRALEATTDLHVMGNPSLLALDHEEATLSVGRKIPYATSNTATTLGLPIQTFDRLDVAMALTVTPHIHDPGMVTLDLELTVDEVEGSSAESALEGGPVTTNREVTSRVMVEHGQTIVLAGVAGTKLERVESKVPILGDIPLIGALFRGHSEETRNTNLMVFLTPYVVERPRDLLEIRKIKEAQRMEFVRRFQGKKGERWLEELQGLVGGAGTPAP